VRQSSRYCSWAELPFARTGRNRQPLTFFA
jgi:hypothetical protein